ncbi:hypothetical protein FQN57_002412 [Myotisia sp. PD_48]|nr:hypothetical protein FQN57_002412 [Myotisia sp. PD_48]
MAYQTRPPPQRGPGPGPGAGGPPPPIRQYGDNRPQPPRGPPQGRNQDPRGGPDYGYGGYPDGYNNGRDFNQQDPYGGRGNRPMNFPLPPPTRPPRGPPPPHPGYNNGSPNGQQYPQPGGRQPPPRQPPPPLRQYPNQQPPHANSPSSPLGNNGNNRAWDNPFPTFPPKNRRNSIDMSFEKQMGALDISDSSNRAQPPIARPHTSNSTRPRPLDYHSEPLPSLPPAIQSMRRNGVPPNIDTRQPTLHSSESSPRLVPPIRSPAIPLSPSATGNKPSYPGKPIWQEPPISPGLRVGPHSGPSSRPSTAAGQRPEPVRQSSGQQAPSQPTVDESNDDNELSTEDLLKHYYDEPDMPNFNAMPDSPAATPHEESLIPLDTSSNNNNRNTSSNNSNSSHNNDASKQSKPTYTAYQAYQPPGGITQVQNDRQNYGANQANYDTPTSPRYNENPYSQGPGDPYHRVMTPSAGLAGGGRGGYPPHPPQNHPQNPYGSPQGYDNRQPYDEMQYGGQGQMEEQYPAYQNPDALPQHPPPFRPGIEQGQKPPPIRQYTNQQQLPASTVPPQIDDGTGMEAGVITFEELQHIQQVVRNNPSDQEAQLVLVKKLVEASIHLIDENGRADTRTRNKNRERYVMEAYKTVKKLVGASYPPAMFYLADCYGQGLLGLEPNPKEAFNLYQSAAKMGHPESAYRLAVCCEMGPENGGGTRRDPIKAVQWYRRAAALGDPPAMYKMGMILLKGLLGQPKNPREALSWLKRAAERADADNPHALHELALLYENPQGNDAIIRDENYALELLHQAAELGYKFSQYRLAAACEYGLLGCPIDPRQSIVWYTRAAAQGEHQSELSLSGWYLTGAEGILQQSDTEAYLWARKAALAGLAKAEYAMGYFTEVGIGVPANMEDAKRWYWKASSQNHAKARERLEDLRRGGAKMQKTRVSRSAVNKHEGDCIVM